MVTAVLMAAPGEPCGVELGRWPHASVQAVAAAGDLVVWGSGSALVVTDVSTPAAATDVGEVQLLDVANDIAVSGSYAYVAVGIGMQVVDLSDPSQPSVVGWFDKPGTLDHSYSVAVAGDTVYLGTYQGVYLLDVSQPDAPDELTLYATGNDPCYAVTISGTTLYIGHESGMLQLVDVLDPDNLDEIGSCSSGGQVFEIVEAGSYLYLAAGFAGFKTVSIATPSAPAMVGGYSAPGTYFGVRISGSRAFVGSHFDGLLVLDIGTPASPSLVTSLALPGRVRDVELLGNRAYVAGWEGGLSIVNLTVQTSPSRQALHGKTGFLERVAVDDGVLVLISRVVGDGLDDFWVLDVSVPSDPVALSSLDLAGTVYDVAMNGRYTYVATDQGLSVVDLVAPGTPVLRDTVPTPAVAYDLVLSDTHAYVGSAGIQVLDLSDPAAPVEVGSIDNAWFTQRYNEALALSYPYLYVVSSPSWISGVSTGLVVIDVSDPLQPIEIVAFDIGDQPESIAVADGLAYVLDFSLGTQIINVGCPQRPAAVTTQPYNWSYDVAVQGGNLMVHGYNGEVKLIDVSDPTNPVLSSGFDGPGHGSSLVVSGSYLYTADSDGGLGIYDISACGTPPTPVLAGGCLFSDGFESGDTAAWSVTVR
jgi:hypothetical protein